MNLFVDTSVWSLALRRGGPDSAPTVQRLARALEQGEELYTTGLVLQELLQGFHGPRSRDVIIARFGDLPGLVPDRRDHVNAAELRNKCRRAGVQIGTIDALFAQLCIRYQLAMLSTDRDYERIAKLSTLQLA